MKPTQFIKSLSLCAVAILVIQASVSAQTITLSPDQGPFYNPLSPNGGTYVYANSFTAIASGEVTDLGAWLNTQTFDASTDVEFEILGSDGGNPANGPDASDVLDETAGISDINGGLTLYQAAPLSGGTDLIAGDVYWFAATVIGSAGDGSYQVGGHTQSNSIPGDTGSFWYSNSSDGSNFDGQNRQPEMAFTVTVGGPSVPDAASSALLLSVALGGLAVARRRFGHA